MPEREVWSEGSRASTGNELLAPDCDGFFHEGRGR